MNRAIKTDEERALSKVSENDRVKQAKKKKKCPQFITFDRFDIMMFRLCASGEKHTF